MGDINQDGLPDVLLADSDGRIWDFLNNGSGGFSLQSKVWGGSYPGFATGLTLAAADLEGDGDLDLIGGLANGGILGLRDPSVGRPTGLIARPGANSVQLDWDANWQSRIRGYYVYRGNALEGPFGKLLPDSVPLPSYLDSPVDPAVPHHYYVTGGSLEPGSGKLFTLQFEVAAGLPNGAKFGISMLAATVRDLNLTRLGAISFLIPTMTGCPTC